MDLAKVLKKIKPSKFEEYVIEKKVNSFLKKLNKNLNDSRAIVGGSFAKGTWLKGKYDIDIFVLFNDDTNASEYLESVLEVLFKNVKRIKGSRDYFQLNYMGLNFEVVPVLKINKVEEARNITDVSPLHVKWVRSKAGRKLCDEIRLTKAFARAQGVYGAETYVKGFSGYVLEILTIYYKGFENLVKGASKWKPYQVIDISKHYEGINKSKVSCLIVVDPIDRERNAAAALSMDKFKKFVNSCNGYLRNKNINFFEKRKITLNDLEDKDLVLKVKPLEGREDVVGTKILKFLQFVEKELIGEGYKVNESDWYWDGDALIWFKVHSVELPKYKKHCGPPLDKKENVKEFKLKWRHEKIYTENNRLYVFIPRRNIFLKDFVKDLLKNSDIKKYVKNVKILK